MTNKIESSNTNPDDAPKIEFPCEDYPIKVMGASGEDYYKFAVSVLKKHAPDLEESKISVKNSRNGTFQSVTFFITATGVDQLQALYDDLKTNPETKMVL